MDTNLHQKIDKIDEKLKKYNLKKNYVSVPIKYHYQSIWSSNQKDFLLNENYIAKLFTNPIKFTGPLKFSSFTRHLTKTLKTKKQFIKTIDLISKHFYNSKMNNLYLKRVKDQIKCSFIIEPNDPQSNSLMKLQQEGSTLFEKITLKNGKYYLILTPIEMSLTSAENKDLKC